MQDTKRTGATRPSNLPATVRATVRREALFEGIHGVLAAVSGGADSVALLHVLIRLCRTHGLALHAIHVHHGLRGRSADADAEFVASLCADLSVPLVQTRGEARTEAHGRGISIEMAARDMRSRLFREIGTATGCDAVATGHHADDRAETVLLRLARGAGPDGLAGIRARSRVDGLWRIRPLMDCRAQAIRDWLRSQGIAWREDASNADVSVARNRVRWLVLPWLECHWSPQLRTHLAAVAQRLDADAALLSSLALDALTRCRMSGEPDALSAAAVRAEPASLQFRLVGVWLRAHGIAAPPGAWIEAVCRLARTSHGFQQRNLARGRAVWRVYDALRLVVVEPPPGRVRATALPVPGWRVCAPGIRVQSRIGVRGTAMAGTGNAVSVWSLALDATVWAGRTLIVRAPRPGDWIRRDGGRRSLQDLLVDARIPAPHRGRVPVLVCAGRIVAVGGLCRAKGWAPRRGRPVLHINLISSRPGEWARGGRRSTKGQIRLPGGPDLVGP